MQTPNHPANPQVDPLRGMHPADEVLRRLQEEHVQIAALASEVARLTGPGQLDGPGAQRLESDLHALRDLLPAHIMKELSIVFSEVEAASPHAAQAVAEARRLHGDLDAKFTSLQAKAIPLLLGVLDPSVQRAARRAALSLKRDCAALNRLGQSEAFAALIQRLPPEAASKALDMFDAADARRRMKEASRP